MANYLYTNEKQLLKKYRMKDFRNITKDKFIKLASNMDKIDPELGKAIVAQFGNFKELANQAISDLSNDFQSVLESDTSITKETLSIYANQIEKLYDMINQHSDDPDYCFNAYNQIGVLNNYINQIHSNHLKSNVIKYGSLVTGVLAIIGGAITILGNTTSIGTSEIDDED